MFFFYFLCASFSFKKLAKTVRYRPQVGFLPNIPLKGSIIPFESPSELKARAVFEQQLKAVASV